MLLTICNLQPNRSLQYNTTIGINRYFIAQRPQDFLTFCCNEALLFFTHCPVHKDVMLGIIVQPMLILFGFWLANIVMNWDVAFFGYQGLTDPATLPLLIVALSVFGLVTMPLGNLWSCWREVKADEYALRMTDNPQAFISAMTRPANQNLADADPPAWVEFLLHSHPSISKRVAMAESFRIEE